MDAISRRSGGRRIAAALVVTAAALMGGVVTAHADGPAGVNSSGPVSFFDQWIAHDSQLQLARTTSEPSPSVTAR